jgi:hypothetical protein
LIVPLFTAQSPNLHASGPVVDVQVLPSRATIQAIGRAGGAPQSPLNLPMMIDTGASVSVIKQGVAQQFGISPIGTQLINTPVVQRGRLLAIRAATDLSRDRRLAIVGAV